MSSYMHWSRLLCGTVAQTHSTVSFRRLYAYVGARTLAQLLYYKNPHSERGKRRQERVSKVPALRGNSVEACK